MSRNYFQFKQFTVYQDKVAMKVCTDACLFGAWISNKIKSVQLNGSPILDIGTGTGLLSLMLAQQFPNYIETVDVDELAVESATRNIAISPWPDRIRAYHGHILNFVPKEKYALILSNPPFFVNDLPAQEAGKRLAKHESLLPLPQLFDYAMKYLSIAGYWAILLPANRNDEALNIAANAGFKLIYKATVQQTPEHQPFRVMLMFSTNQVQPETENIIIRSGSHYSQRFVQLLQPYYLYL
ncbi:tRNA1(Val) (adenine(37)-N6)-methyltransferase [Flavihumibacter fluvii]|uniref:tRNA1(Val) (adenine(37)-N6)-methyltransferase n=1 Tax=Flavihumibacter fluvii TaxID=2838157 RepID=UPI001BDF71D1|nr:methyltransferase [Flavihumibacter fluvii]ULQ53864.1 methyltransferase [Flavihumibacter fluvii]